MSSSAQSRGSKSSRPASRSTRILPAMPAGTQSDTHSTVQSNTHSGDITPDKHTDSSLQTKVDHQESGDGSDCEDNDEDIMQLGGLLRGLDTVDEHSMTSSQSSLYLPFILPRPNESVDAAIKDWCATREVHRFHPSRKVIRDTFLVEHKELPSVEFALQGLLLDENPYTEDDPLIKANMDRDVGEINVYV